MFFSEFFGKKKPLEQRDAAIAAALRGETVATETVTRDEALGLPAVGACVDFIAGTVSALPVRLFERTGDSVKEITDDPRLGFLNADTGDTLTAQQLKRALVADYLLDGAGYAYVERSGNNVKGVYYAASQYVSVMEGADKIKKDVSIMIMGKEYPEFSMMRMTRRSQNGVTGQGVLKQYPLLFSTIRNSLRFENSSISTGTKRGFLKTTAKLSPEAMSDLRGVWRRLTSTMNGGGADVLVLNQGLDFISAGSTATENQLNESKKANFDLVCAVFGLPSGIFSASGVGTEGYLSAIRTAVLPVVDAMESAINKTMLLEKEKGTFFFQVDTRDIMKASLAERYQSYATALQAGFMQIDEVRRSENLEPLGLDFLKFGLADVFYYPESGKVFTPNTAVAANTEKDSIDVGGNKDQEEKTDEN